MIHQIPFPSAGSFTTLDSLKTFYSRTDPCTKPSFASPLPSCLHAKGAAIRKCLPGCDATNRLHQTHCGTTYFRMSLRLQQSFSMTTARTQFHRTMTYRQPTSLSHHRLPREANQRSRSHRAANCGTGLAAHEPHATLPASRHAMLQTRLGSCEAVTADRTLLKSF